MTAKRPDRERVQSKLEFDPPLDSFRPSVESPEAPTGPGSGLDNGPDLGSLPLFPEQTPPDDGVGDSGVKSPVDLVLEDGSSVESKQATLPKGEFLDQAPLETREEHANAPLGVPLASRLLAGLADLAIHGAVVVLLLAGQTLLTSSPPSFVQLPAYGVFLLAFSFLYTVVPLAFWGQTPGMSALGLRVRAVDGENLTFPQTTIRWATGLLTCALLGLPLLVAKTGRSLGDRLGRSVTLQLDA